MANLLILINDVLGEKMAGPGIRAWEMAKAVSKYHGVTVAAYAVSGISHPRVKAVSHEESDARVAELIKSHDVVLAQPFIYHGFPSIAASGKVVIVDLYDPYILEYFEMHKASGAKEREEKHRLAFDTLKKELAAGDYFLCASPRQRDFWVGMLTALGRITPRFYDTNPSLDGFVDVVPFGLDAEPPKHPGGPVLKGVIPGIEENDKVLVWGGGLWNWFDTKTLARAMAKLSDTCPDIKLFFMGTVHPHPGMPEFQMKNARETVALARELGLTGRNVFFNEGWIPYDKRGAYLLEADMGVSTHFNNLETRFSFRTRILDYLWAGLPIITTQGDYMAELVGANGLGRVVGYEDADGLAEAIMELAKDAVENARCRDAVSRVRGEFTWEKVCEPLNRFLANPVKLKSQGIDARPDTERPGASGYIHAFFSYLKTEGLTSTLKRLTAFIGRRL
jgi:glycosyltransferase involved in cell wall biosynthesis